MIGLYDETQKKLDKLKSNESQMTPEMKIQYERPLRKLRSQIAKNMEDVLTDFLSTGIETDPEDDTNEIKERIRKIIREERAQGLDKKLSGVLYETYSIEKSLEAAYGLYLRIRYEAYGPYWLSKCRQEGSVWTNSIINMRWNKKTRVWEGLKVWRAALPPTKEELDAEYKKEMLKFEEQK